MSQRAPLERTRLQRKDVEQEVLEPADSSLRELEDENSSRLMLKTPTPDPSINSTVMLLPGPKLPK